MRCAATGVSASIPYTLTGGGNALVVGSYTDGEIVPSNFQFAGAGADGSVVNERVWLAYFFDPAASGNVTLDFTTTRANAAYFIFELGNVDTSATVDITSANSITTTVDDRFVAYFQGVNNDPGGSLVPATGSIVTVAGAGDSNGAIGGGSVGAAYSLEANTGAAGSKFLGLDGFGGGFPQFEAGVAFSAVPEPSTPLIAGAALLGLAALRRRSQER